MREDRFRADLHSRLAHMVVTIPPLRERRSEILTLAAAIAGENGRADWLTSADAAEALARYAWPFNVRELEAMVRVFIALDKSSTLDQAYLKEQKPAVLPKFRDTAGEDGPSSGPSDRPALEALLKRHRGNVSSVAKDLGKPRALVYRRLKALGLDATRFRGRG